MTRLSLLVLAACAAALEGPPRARRATALGIRGGATKKKKAAKQLDPTGTPVAARLLRPVTLLCDKYEALAEREPLQGLAIQLGLTLGTMKLITRVLAKADKTKATLLARLAYACFLALHQLVLSLVEGRVEAADDETPLTLPGNPLLAQLAAKQGGGDAAAALAEKLGAKETTVKAYDLDLVAKARRSQVGSVLVTGFLHLKKGMLQPLVAQIVMGLFALFKEPLVQVHVLGAELPRPFPPPQPAWLKALQAQQAEAASADAEPEEIEAAAEDEEDVEEDEDDLADEDDDEEELDDEEEDGDDLDDEEEDEED